LGRLAVDWLSVWSGSRVGFAEAEFAGQAPAVGERAEAGEDRQAADPEQQTVLQSRRAAATGLRRGRGERGACRGRRVRRG
jgi:hypothetical protein